MLMLVHNSHVVICILFFLWGGGGAGKGGYVEIKP